MYELRRESVREQEGENSKGRSSHMEDTLITAPGKKEKVV